VCFTRFMKKMEHAYGYAYESFTPHLPHFKLLKLKDFQRDLTYTVLYYKLKVKARTVDRVLGFFSSRPNSGTPPPPPPPPSAGGTHSLAGEGVLSPNSDEGTDTVVLYVYYRYFVHRPLSRYRIPMLQSYHVFHAANSPCPFKDVQIPHIFYAARNACNHGLIDYEIKTPNPKCRLYWWVFNGLEIQSVMQIPHFSTILKTLT
jgi:hypothetical protein